MGNHFPIYMITQLNGKEKYIATVKNQISFMTLEDCKDLPPVTDNMHGYILLEDEAQVLGGIITSSLLVSLIPCFTFVEGWENK